MKVLNARCFAVGVVVVVVLVGCGESDDEAASEAASTTAAPSTTVASSPTTTAQDAPSSTIGAWSDDLVVQALGTVEGAPLGYLEYLPPGYGDGAASPLLLFLHGGGEAGDGSAGDLTLVAKLGIPQLIAADEWPDEHPFVVVSPQYGLEPASGDCAVADDVAGFLDFAIDHYEVDPERVYLTGISCGAIGVWDYLGVHGDDVVAAVVPISGHAEWALETSDCETLGEVPVWAFHGELDDIVPPIHIQGPMETIEACDGASEMELTVYPDADHDAWTRTYDLSAGHDIYAWMLDHARD